MCPSIRDTRLAQLVLGSLISGSLAACLVPPPQPATTPITPVAATAPSPPAVPARKLPVSAYRWRSVEILGGGFVTGLEFSPVARDIVYARTDIGGAYRLNPKDDSWIPLTDFLNRDNSHYLGIESVAPDPVEANRVYMAVGLYSQSWAQPGAFMRSTDRGEHWEVFPTPGLKMGGNEEGRGNGERLAIDPNDTHILYFGSRRWGLWKSEDRAATWQQVPGFPIKEDATGFGIPLVVFDRKSGTPGKPTPVIYVGVTNKDVHLYRSKDAGTTWAPVPRQPTGLVPTHAELDGLGVLYLSYGATPGPSNVPDGAVWKYDTQQEQWTDITPLKPGAALGDGVFDRFGYSALALDGQNPGTLITATIDRWTVGGEIFRSRDGGKTWVPLSNQAKFDPGAAAYLTEPGQANFNPIQWISDVAIDPFNADHAYFLTGGGVWLSKDLTAGDRKAPTHWQFANQNLEEFAVLEMASPPVGPQLLTAVGDLCGFHHQSIEKSPTQFRNPPCANSTGIDFAQAKPNVVVRVGSYHWVGPKDPRGAISFDAGVTWTRFASEPSQTEGSGTVAVSADGQTIIWASRGTKVARSVDNGKTWATVEGLPAATKIADWAPAHLRIAADRVNPRKFYVYDALDGSAYFSSDGGAHFTASTTGIKSLPEYNLGPASIRAVPGIEGDVWMTTGSSLLHSTDSGRTYPEVDNVQESYAIGFGKAAPGAKYPAIYLSGKLGDAVGYFRSADGGAQFVRINDDAHQFGGSNLIMGDPRAYGRVYVAGHGRGVVFGEPLLTAN